MKKKIIALLMVVMLVATLTACSSNDKNTGGNGDPETFTVGLTKTSHPWALLVMMVNLLVLT